jgi:glutamate synthase (NADPH/NADH) large chain
LDKEIVKDAQRFLEDGEKMQLTYTVRNTMRAIGTRVSHHIVKKYGMHGLNPGRLTLELRGSAGQSLGAFAVQGLKLKVFGDANDYVGKGLSGATIAIRPMVSSPLESQDNTIIGNTVLYGATAGKLFAAGQAGERFAVRNSGALTVIEGCGSNGCEYMTGGLAAILGRIGANFAAGMTGGMAFVRDPGNEFADKVNPDSVVWQRLESQYWENTLVDLIEEHVAETGSRHAKRILQQWDLERGAFWQVCPKEMLSRLKHPLSDRPTAVRA